MDHISNQSAIMLAALRRTLRAEGWTNKRLAGHFNTSESTVKRWLSGKALQLDQFAQLAELCGLTLAELAREADSAPSGLAQELTLAQQQALSEDHILAFLFMAILSGERWQDLETEHNVPAGQIEAALTRLDKLALIDRLPGDRARALVDRALLWRKAPMRQLFENRMKAQFFNLDYGDPQSHYVSEMLKLSAAGAATLAEMFERFRRDVQQLAENDRRNSQLPRRWHGVLLVERALDMSTLNDI